MKKVYSILYVFIALVVVTTAVSCSDDDAIPLSTLASIDSFEIAFENVATEDVDYDLGNTITISVPFGTNLEALMTTIGVSEKATIVPASGTAITYVDGESKTFVVTAEDETTTKTYNVIVNVRGEVGSGTKLKTYTLADAFGENSVSTYTYTSFNFVDEITKEEDDFGDIITTTFKFVYNDHNQIIEKKSEADKISIVYDYNSLGQIVKATYKKDDELTYTYTYVYDASTGNLVSETRTDHSDDDSESVVSFTIENGNVVIENRFGSDYIASYDDKKNPFKEIYPKAYANIMVGIQSVNTNNPIEGTLSDEEIVYEYNTNDYPVKATYTYFDGFATVQKDFIYFED